MRATLWSDYLCPWCYLGRDRTRLLGELGVEVTHLPYELHPEVPLEGTRVRPGGRLATVLAAIGEECSEVGMPFEPPTRLPNTRRALEAAEIVRVAWQDRFQAVDDALFESVFVRGDDLADPAVLASRIDAAGAPADEVDARLAAGDGARAVDTSMATARDVGVTATPAWLLDTGLLIPGVQPRPTITRWIEKIREKQASATGRRQETDAPSSAAAPGGT